MRILAIGGTGFIGRHVVRFLVEMGHDVAVFHRSMRTANLPSQVRHLFGDRMHLAAHLPEFRHFAPHVVLLMVLPQGNDRSAREFVTAFTGIAQRAVVTSSRDVYRAFNRLYGIEGGAPDPVPLTEESPLREKLYPYRTLSADPAWHDYDDILVERVVMSERRLPATVLRLLIIYGPEDDHFHRTFPYLKRMDDGRPVILLDDQRAPFQDSRVYVEDAAWAIALASTNARSTGRIYNVAPQRTLTEAEWVESLGRVVGWRGSVVPMPREKLPAHLVRDLDFRHHLALSSARIRHELAYAERVPFEIGCRTTVEWQRTTSPPIDTRAFDYEAEDAALMSQAP